MSTITYENLQVAGIPYEKILDLSISHEPNAHGCARIKGRILMRRRESSQSGRTRRLRWRL